MKPGGCINQTMSLGVQGAFAFVYLVTENYQKSLNCKKEAQYAEITLESDDMFPVMAEKGYDLKGAQWLGLLSAGKLYTECRKDDKSRTDTELKNLATQLKEKMDAKK